MLSLSSSSAAYFYGLIKSYTHSQIKFGKFLMKIYSRFCLKTSRLTKISTNLIKYDQLMKILRVFVNRAPRHKFLHQVVVVSERFKPSSIVCRKTIKRLREFSRTCFKLRNIKVLNFERRSKLGSPWRSDKTTAWTRLCLYICSTFVINFVPSSL